MNLEVVILREDTEKNKEKTSKRNPDDTKGKMP